MKELAKELLQHWREARNETRFSLAFSRLVPQLHEIATAGDQPPEEPPTAELPSDRPPPNTGKTRPATLRRNRTRKPARQGDES